MAKKALVQFKGHSRPVSFESTGSEYEALKEAATLFWRIQFGWQELFLKKKDEDWGDQYVDITATEEIADKAVIQIQVGTTTYPSLCLI